VSQEANRFNPIEDADFVEGLYKRKQFKTEGGEIDPSKFYTDPVIESRHGLTPPTKNVRNIRYKKK